ncbi:hypothetical protein N9Z63_01085 [bacterium]|nr:hypothetical protein [bacterium]
MTIIDSGEWAIGNRERVRGLDQLVPLPLLELLEKWEFYDDCESKL